MISFNGSIELQMSKFNKMNYNKTYGYDLGFIHNRSDYRLTPINKMIKVKDETAF